VNRSASSTVRRGTSAARSTSSYRPSPSVSAYDPRLGDARIKQEERNTPDVSLNEYPLPRSVTAYSGTTAVLNHPVTRSRLAQQAQPQSSTPASHRSTTELSTRHYGEPSRRNFYTDPITTARTTVKRRDEEDTTDDENELPGFNERSAATPVLKGVKYPGMAIFDSATPIGRRRRNQKKSASVLEQLEANSLDVVPTENVWTPNGSLKKTREIDGFPSSSSPCVSPEQPPVTINRPPLGQIESRHAWANQAGLTRYNSYTDQRLEDALTYGDYDTRKRKRALSVYHDANEPLTGTLSQPITMNVLRKASRPPHTRQPVDTDDEDDSEDYKRRQKLQKNRSSDAADMDARAQVRRRLMFDNVKFDGNGRRTFGAQGPLQTQLSHQQPTNTSHASEYIHSSQRQMGPVQQFNVQAPAVFDFNSGYGGPVLPRQAQAAHYARQPAPVQSHSRHQHSLSIEHLLNFNPGLGNVSNASMNNMPTTFSNGVAQVSHFMPPPPFDGGHAVFGMPDAHAAIDWNTWSNVLQLQRFHPHAHNQDPFTIMSNAPAATDVTRAIRETSSPPSVGDLPVSSRFLRNVSGRIHTANEAAHYASNHGDYSAANGVTHGTTASNPVVVADDDDQRTVSAPRSHDGFTS
jgi:hypothetical protein